MVKKLREVNRAALFTHAIIASDPMSYAFHNRRILLIISGGIAAYKSLELIRRLREQGAQVRCVLTQGGAQFVTPLSVSALSEDKVYGDLWSLTDEQQMGHIRLSREADLVMVAPASANLIAKMAQGIADDLASTVLLATDKPVMIAPAMNVMMWDNAATQANILALKKRGIKMVGPSAGLMACGEEGMGRMTEVAEILAAIGGLFCDAGAIGRQTRDCDQRPDAGAARSRAFHRQSIIRQARSCDCRSFIYKRGQNNSGVRPDKSA